MYKKKVEIQLMEGTDMDFGLFIRREQTYPKMLELSLKAEELNYFGVFLNDHVIGFRNDGLEPYLEAWTAMSGIGVQTDKIRVGHIVLFNSLRNPAYLAKSIATLDQMTNGRYELMIGAGWNEKEYKGYDLMEKGRGMPSAKARVDRFEESLEIINLMLSQPVTNYKGQFWELDGAINIPQPVQKPMRVSVGCKGSRMMAITAKHATGINLSGRTLSGMEELIGKFSRIARDKVGKSKKDYYISGFSGLYISEDESSINNYLKERINLEESLLEKAKKDRLVGPPEEIISKLSYLDKLGVDMIVTHIQVDPKLSTDPLVYFKDEIVSSI